VVPEEEFRAWYFGGEDAPVPGRTMAAVVPAASQTVDPGLAVLEKNSCLACHSLDGEVMVGPTLKGLFGSEQTIVEADGTEREIVVDEAYLEKAIQEPMAETVKGYPPAMPPQPLSDEDLQAVIDYIKTLE
jgi:cytochrome c oxidase subunit 2